MNKQEQLAAQLLDSMQMAEPPSCPIWYSKSEIYSWLTSHNYSKEIAEALSQLIADALQASFKKGWEKGYNDFNPNKSVTNYTYYTEPMGVQQEEKEFVYFPNHGDEDGRNSFTICYAGKDDEGEYDFNDCIIVATCDTEEDATESCKRLNSIIGSAPAKAVEAMPEKMKCICRTELEQQACCATCDKNPQRQAVEAMPEQKFEEGFELACQMLDEMYAHTSSHPYNIADCLRAKRNKLATNKIRPTNLAEAMDSLPAQKGMKAGNAWTEYIKQFSKLNEFWNNLPEVTRLWLSQQIDIFAGKYPLRHTQKGMKWVKPSERNPTKSGYYFTHGSHIKSYPLTYWDDDKSEWSDEIIEWLDESASSSNEDYVASHPSLEGKKPEMKWVGTQLNKDGTYSDRFEEKANDYVSKQQ